MVSLFFLILFISKQSMAGKKSRRILGEIYVHLVKLEAEWIKIYIKREKEKSDSHAQKKNTQMMQGT